MNEMKNTRRKYFAAALLVCVALVAVVLAGCSSEPSTPKEIVKKAIEAQGKLKSVKVQFDGSMQVTGNPGGQASTSYQGNGFYESPDRSKLVVNSPTGEVQVITIGDKAYVKSPTSNGWAQQKVPENMAAGASPTDIRDYLKYTKNLKMVEKTSDGYHLRFTVDISEFAKHAKMPAGVQPPSTSGLEETMDVWVQKGNFFVERARMEFSGKMGPSTPGNLAFSLQLNFSDFNKPVTIEAP